MAGGNDAKMTSKLVLVSWLVISLAVPFSSDAAQQELVAAPGSIQVDGSVDETWQSAPAVRLKRSVVVLTRTDPDQWPKSLFRCLWDEKFLYVLAEVDDSTPGNTNSTPWEQDSVEIFLDENQGRTKFFQADDAQIRVARTGHVTGTDFREPEVVRSAVMKTDRGYLVEMAIDWRTIKPESAKKIGIDFQVSDDPGIGRRMAILKWSDPSDETWRDTSRYGTLILGTAEQAAAAVAEATRIKANDAVEPSKSDDSSSNADIVSPNDQSGLKGDSPVSSRGNGGVSNSLISGSTRITAPFSPDERVPDWVADAVFYQLFPERFRNGDTSNDPTRQSLEFPDIIPPSWHVTPWTQQWYRRCPWEVEMGSHFYENGVFHRRYGGDLQGVLDKLDYLSDLGINTIYFNPVFYARSLHKYDGSSFHHIDPHFGPDPIGDFELMSHESDDPKTWHWTKADQLFLAVIQQARQRGIRIIIDGVFNHTGRDFFAFADIVHNQQKSAYLDWYNVRQFNDPATALNEFKYDCWWGIDTLPEFAASADGTDLNPGPKNYIMNATKRWMDPNGDGDPEDGIDGWRLDVANEVPSAFWRDWHQLVRSINASAYTVAEIWDESSSYLADCQFSSTMNYHGFAFPLKGFLIDNTLPASQFAELFTSRNQLHSTAVQFGLLNLMDSHDTDRLASMIVNARQHRTYKRSDRFDYDVGEVVSPRHSRDYNFNRPTATDRQIQKLVSLFQFCVPGPPMIYYGTEAGMDGADDPDDRMPMVWADMNYEARSVGPDGKLLPEQEVSFDQSLHGFYRDLIQLRKGYKALRRGELRFVWADDNQQALLLTRQLGSEVLMIAVNRSSRTASIPLKSIDKEFSNQTQLDLVFSTTGEVSARPMVLANPELQWKLPPLTGQVWKLTTSETAASQ